MTTGKPAAALSIDLDNEWSYLKIHGDGGWDKYPSFLDLVVRRSLPVLKQMDLTVTFFVVGQDAALGKNHEALRSIADAGHEIGNHSYRHESWLHLYSPEELQREFEQSEQAISQATGVLTRGFRGPGYSLSEEVLRTLQRRGYHYDTSTLPTFLGPLSRAYYFMKSGLSGEEREKRRMLFGSLSDGLRPLKPYRWNLGGGLLPEIPVTTMPVLRTPFHLSYIIYVATYSKAIARLYWRSALGLCRLFGVTPSILLHPLDFLGSEDVSTLRFFPGMTMQAGEKMELVAECITDLAASFEVLPIDALVARLGSGDGLPVVAPRFAHRRGDRP